MAMIRLNVQLVQVATELQTDLPQRGYISELTVHGMGAMPAAKDMRYAARPTMMIQEFVLVVGQ